MLNFLPLKADLIPLHGVDTFQVSCHHMCTHLYGCHPPKSGNVGATPVPRLRVWHLLGTQEVLEEQMTPITHGYLLPAPYVFHFHHFHQVTVYYAPTAAYHTTHTRLLPDPSHAWLTAPGALEPCPGALSRLGCPPPGSGGLVATAHSSFDPKNRPWPVEGKLPICSKVGFILWPKSLNHIHMSSQLRLCV